MSYQVLARKWRPHNFTEIVGQEHVVKALVNALQHNRLHHAYLFTGTRGVGKTTIARILAKALNCEGGSDFNPCGCCAVCRDVDEGHFIDLIEVDAASRTKVEDTRELLENAQYAPNRGRYKIYLIDEVHMLSGHSFNALLKTLEEPPPHIKFLLATTDPQKVPVTVLSRCLQFNLKRLLPDQIHQQMAFILGEEHTEFEEAGLKLLARAADGSMRDGLSLLDQAIVFGGGRVRADDVRAMLGTVARQPVDELLKTLAGRDAAGILSKIDELAGLSADFQGVLQQLLQLLHRIALTQAMPSAADLEEHAETIREMAENFTPEEVQLYYQIALKGKGDLMMAPDPRSGFEMVMLRMLAFRPLTEVVRTDSDGCGGQPQPNRTSTEARQTSLNPPSRTVARLDESWSEMIQGMGIGGMTRELANNCVLGDVDDRACTLFLDPGHRHLLGNTPQENLQKALQAYYGKPLKLIVEIKKTEAETPAGRISRERQNRQVEAEESIEQDENVRVLKEKFGARVIPGSIEPV
ncbi:MAG: DNA polymerase III subunit gamma/tau [Gammaproteobacteria bacterium]